MIMYTVLFMKYCGSQGFLEYVLLGAL